MDISTILRNHGIDVAKVGGDGGTVNTTILPTALITTDENQKVWEIPQGRFDKESDSMVVFHNTIYLDPSSYTLTGDAATGYKITIADAPDAPKEDNNVNILVFKNYAEVGSLISGTQLTDGSVGMSKLGQDVQDLLNNPQVEIVDNLTTEDATKALSANQGTVIKEALDKTLKKNYYSGDNQYFNLSSTFAARQFDTHIFENDITSELCEITIPFYRVVTGIFKFTMVSSYAHSDASGGAEVIVHVGVTDSGALYHKTTDIITMSSTFADNFYIKEIEVDSQNLKLGIIKRQRENGLSVQMTFQTVLGNAWNVVTSAQVNNYPMNSVVSLIEYPKQYSIVQSTPRTTSRSMDIFVSSETGSDVSGIGTREKPYRTIQFAVDKLPQVINHNISIYLNEGSYSENVIIIGKIGRGFIQIMSINTNNRRNYKVANISLYHCQIKINLYYLSITGNNNGLTVENCNYVNVSGVDVYGTGNIGASVKSSKVFFNSGGFWDKNVPVNVSDLSTVLLDSVGGANNTYSISATYGAEVIKSGIANIGSKNGEFTGTGGIIR